MDILLIDPPYISLKGVVADCGYNMGLTSLAAYLRREGIEAAVLTGDLLEDLPPDKIWTDMKDYAAGQRDYERIVSDQTYPVWKALSDFVRQANPMAVGISYYTPLKHTVERVADLVREIDPEIQIIAGAFHPTYCPGEVMQNQDIDFVIRGEGEIPLLRLVQELKKENPNMAIVPGIYYRDRAGQIQNNPGVKPLQNLDELPLPARDLVLNCDYRRYRNHCLSSARGCPYACSFCGDKRFWGGKVRRRSVGNVIEELKFLKDTYDITFVDFVDGTFTFDRKYLETFCRALIDQNLNMRWRCTARYDNLNEVLLKLLKRSGCAGLYLGLESGSDRVLKAINKKITLQEIIKVSNMVHDIGIFSVTSILLGLPDETKEEIEETLSLMKRIKTDLFDVNSFTPLPGTPLYDSMTEEEKNIDWRKVGKKSLNNYFSKTMPREEFDAYLFEAYEIAARRRNWRDHKG